jgi:hypothetical protein
MRFNYAVCLAISLFGAFSLAGCESNPCKAASDKLVSCGVPKLEFNGIAFQGFSGGSVCPAERAASAKCISGLSCDELRGDPLKIAECVGKKK